MADYELRNLLYKSKTALTAWPGLSCGNDGTPGVVSTLNKSSRQKAKISVVALAIEKLMASKISVCPVKGQTLTYVEYQSSTGDVKSFLVDVDAANKAYSILSDESYDKALVAATFAATFFNPRMKKEIVDAGFEVKEIEDSISSLPMVSADQMYVACDAYYYSLGKNFRVSYDVDATKFDATKTRLAQGGLFEFANGTASPAGVKIDDDGKQQANEVQGGMFTEPLGEFMKRCKRGEFVFKRDWNDDQKKTIKPLTYLDMFVPTEEFRELLISVWTQLNEIKEKVEQHLSWEEVMAEPINVLVMGKPGSGKTVMIEALFCALGYPHGFINCKDRSEEDEFEGLQKFIKGHICAIPTQLTRFYSVGGGVLLEEINLPDPGIMQGAIGQALVYPYVLKFDGYMEFRRDPFTIIVGTMNVGTNGTKPLNQALKSRFAETYVLEDVEDESFKSVLYSTGYDHKYCDLAFKAYKAAITYLTDNGNSEFVLSITMRSCKKAIQKLANGFTRKQAFRSAFVGQIYSEDPEVALDLEEWLDKMV